MEVEVHKERLFRHEFGHYVVARALGFPTGGISISLRVEGCPPIVRVKGGSDIRLSEGIGSLNDLRQYLERRIAVLYAGACAETLKPRSHDLKVDSDKATKCQGADGDFAKASELMHLLRNVLYSTTDCYDDSGIQREINELKDKLWTKAIQVVERFAKTIVSLAEELKRRIGDGTTCVVSASVLEAMPEVQNIVLIEEFDDLSPESQSSGPEAENTAKD